jgi:hypothetical protein
MSPEVFYAKPFTRLKQLEHLLRTQQIDDSFFWNVDTTQDDITLSAPALS